MIKKPSIEQEKLFIEKSIKHIRLIQDNMIKIAFSGGFLGISPVDIVKRAFLHDFSKFDEDTYEGYVWYYARNYAREKKLPIPEYSEEREEFILECVKKHRSNSRHHPEYFKDVNDMEPLDIIEMVCDWTAISQSNILGIYKSVRDFTNQNIGTKYMFDEAHQRQIYKVIDLLTTLNGKEW